MLCQLLYLFIHKVTALVEGVTWYPGRVVEVVGVMEIVTYLNLT